MPPRLTHGALLPTGAILRVATIRWTSSFASHFRTISKRAGNTFSFKRLIASGKFCGERHWPEGSRVESARQRD